MKLQLTVANCVAFCLFALLMGEAHEVSHFLVGKTLCGCWPVSRDFNAWEICACQSGHWVTITGPVFSMLLAWVGMYLIRKDKASIQSFGFVLIWANVPQARIMTVLMGGGDEKVFFREFLHGTSLEEHYSIIAVGFVAFLALPPIVTSFWAVSNKYGWMYNLGFMILPLVVLGIYGFFLLNKLLERGFLSDVWIMGTPLFITLHTITVLIVLLGFFRKQLFTLAVDNQRVLYN